MHATTTPFFNAPFQNQILNWRLIMKVKYIIDDKKFTYVECATKEEADAVKEMNKEMEAFIKSEKRFNKRIVKIDHITNTLGEEESIELPAISEDMLSNLIKKERIAAIYDALNQLTSKQKDIFLMVVVEDLSTYEIAKKMQVKQQTVFKQYKSALQKIKEITKYLK